MNCNPVPRKTLKPLEDCLRTNGSPGDLYCNGVAIRTIIKLSEETDEEREYVGEGAHRTVFGLGKNCILKVAHGKIEAGSNLNEIRAWDTLKRQRMAIKHNFVPVLAHSPYGAWLVMPRASRRVGDEAVDVVSDNLERLGIECNDIHDDNVGLWKGRYVVIDYEGFEKCHLRSSP